ncbi:uncharacterized protein angptl8 isoform X3 [Thunnus maccoyii]|uniref:uncharacterized protein angptl8 isoform X3 n=1 Tax=Thunnus maccoyii TaxID=8240 RepID=UPI001C4D0B26|nr:uncharacterized protein angptl8 isoform X3 [Thunnus maccoyii]
MRELHSEKLHMYLDNLKSEGMQLAEVEKTCSQVVHIGHSISNSRHYRYSVLLHWSRAGTQVLPVGEAQMAKQQAQTTMTKDWLARMEQEEVELATKVRRVEMNLNNLFPSNIKELQERAAEHSHVLKSLQHFTQFQKENIETNNEQLSTLQKMVSHLFKTCGWSIFFFCVQ